MIGSSPTGMPATGSGGYPDPEPEVTMHVIYWEAAGDGKHLPGCRWDGSCHGVCRPCGIAFGTNPVEKPWLPKGVGASFCYSCDSVVCPWANRLDNMHCTLRACGKEGRGFRKEVEYLSLIHI